MRDEQELFRNAKLAITLLVLRSQSETASALLCLAAFMLTLAAPVCVPKIDPHAAVLREARFAQVERLDEATHKIFGVCLEAYLPINFVIALSVKRGLCYDAIHNDLVSGEQAQSLANF